MSDYRHSLLEDRDDLIAWLLRDCDCTHKRTGEPIRNRDDAEEMMRADRERLQDERDKEGRAA